MPETPYTAYQESPIGWLRIAGTENGVSEITFLDENPCISNAAIPGCLQACYQQIAEYFNGSRREFELYLSPIGTDFQQKTWQFLNQIPFGKTQSYLDIAKQLGGPTYTRAVGTANGRNPLAIVVPCHRVIGANGALTGYAGGLWRKKWLLQFEGAPRQTELFT